MNAPVLATVHTIPTPLTREMALDVARDDAQVPLLSALAALRRWAMPRRVLLIGAGPGTGPWIAHLMSAPAVPVTLVEADARQHERLAQVLKARAPMTSTWQVEHALVAGCAGERDFHSLNVASESGVYPADRLTSAWPGLSTLEQRRCSAVALESLVVPDPKASDWLIIDCLGGLDMLRHAPRVLAQAQVIGVRALKGVSAQSAPELSCTAVGQHLQAQGYLCVAEQAERHPDVMRLVFVRNDRARLQALEDEHVRLREQHDDLARQLEDSLAGGRETHAQWQAEREAWAAERQASDARQAEQVQRHQHDRAAWQARWDALQESHQHGQAEQAALNHKRQQLEAELVGAHNALAAAHTHAAGWQRECAAVRHAAEGQQAIWLRRLEAAEQVRDAVDAQRASTQHLMDLTHQQAQVLAALPEHVQAVQQRLSGLVERVATDLEGWGHRLSLHGSATAATVNDAVRDLVEQEKSIDQKALWELEQRVKAATVASANNAVKQLEAFIGIQQHFPDGGAGLLDYHGWPISPDIGLFLLERIQSRNYDLIIEFGSGTSTVLFAKAMQPQRPKRGRAGSARADERRRIVTFEHQALYRDGTLERLRAQKLDARVDLQLAPLVHWQHGEQSFQYYDCADALDRLALDLQGAGPLRILVFVDGPPGATCANARFPAIPMVFDRFGHHQIDVVLDDANRPEEMAVVELWRQYFALHSCVVAERRVPSEKGIFLAEAGPLHRELNIGE